jgi:hypothetical protein
VLFVTENAGKVAFHVASTKGGEAIEIDGKGSTFGWRIGTKKPVDEPFTEWIESVTNGQVVLASAPTGERF